MAKSAEQMRTDVQTVREFVKAAEKIKVVIPGPLKVALASFERATDVGVAFENVCIELDRFDHDFQSYLASKYDMHDWMDADQAAVEEAARFGLHQQRATQAVLSINDDRSMASQLYREWRPKIRDVLSDHTKSMVRKFLERIISR